MFTSILACILPAVGALLPFFAGHHQLSLIQNSVNVYCISCMLMNMLPHVHARYKQKVDLKTSLCSATGSAFK